MESFKCDTVDQSIVTSRKTPFNNSFINNHNNDEDKNKIQKMKKIIREQSKEIETMREWQMA